MATQTTMIDADWLLIANEADDPFGAQPYHRVVEVEYRATATSALPDADELGHVLLPHEQMTRAFIGPGYIHARRYGSSKAAIFVVSGSTVDLEGSS